MGTAAVDPFEEVRLLQRQVEEGVLKVPEQDVPERLALVGEEAVPQGQSRAVPGDAQQEHGADGHAVLEEALFAPSPTYDLINNQTKRRKTWRTIIIAVYSISHLHSIKWIIIPDVYQNLQQQT